MIRPLLYSACTLLLCLVATPAFAQEGAPSLSLAFGGGLDVFDDSSSPVSGIYGTEWKNLHIRGGYALNDFVTLDTTVGVGFGHGHGLFEESTSQGHRAKLGAGVQFQTPWVVTPILATGLGYSRYAMDWHINSTGSLFSNEVVIDAYGEDIKHVVSLDSRVGSRYQNDVMFVELTFDFQNQIWNDLDRELKEVNINAENALSTRLDQDGSDIMELTSYGLTLGIGARF